MAVQFSMEKLAAVLESSIREAVRKLKVITRHAEALALELRAETPAEERATPSPPPEDHPPS